MREFLVVAGEFQLACGGLQVQKAIADIALDAPPQVGSFRLTLVERRVGHLQIRRSLSTLPDRDPE